MLFHIFSSGRQLTFLGSPLQSQRLVFIDQYDKTKSDRANTTWIRGKFQYCLYEAPYKRCASNYLYDFPCWKSNNNWTLLIETFSQLYKIMFFQSWWKLLLDYDSFNNSYDDVCIQNMFISSNWRTHQCAEVFCCFYSFYTYVFLKTFLKLKSVNTYFKV